MQSTTSDSQLAPDQVLSEDELSRLTLWKWRYSLEAIGFTSQQAADLTFLTYLRASGRL